MKSLCVLGRQPALGLAELESLYGASAVRPLGDCGLVDIDPCLLAFDRLGGSIKFCKVLATLDASKWPDIIKFLCQVAPPQSEKMPAGKMHLGLSLHGFNITSSKIMAGGLTIKKAIAKTGRSVRLVPNQEASLSSAQVIHNKLTSENGWELILVKDGRQTIVAQTIKVQDIAAYAARDRQRPKRDAKIGMLPPKLAQIIINLAAGELPAEKLQSICEIPAGAEIPRPKFNQTILDPFCGTGVILQEARLMGYQIYGTDLEPRMIDYSRANLDWLAQNYKLQTTNYKLEPADASNHTWQKPINCVASETYLGRPFTSKPSSQLLEKTASEVNLILKKFLKNIHGQLNSGARLCLAVPAWNLQPKLGQPNAPTATFQFPYSNFRHLPLIDQLENLGYNQIRFKHVPGSQLIYFRPGQLVARELLVLVRK
ncbi:MAG: TRM11 family SAM-dependent methyltransferase [Candidatus Saccharimonadales bacterium]